MADWCASEHDEQSALVQWAAALCSRYPELSLLYAVPNGGDRHPVVAGKLQAEGAKKGVPDLVLPYPGGGYAGLYVEMKRCRGGRLAREQAAWIRALSAVGYKVLACHGWDAARREILSYLDAAPRPAGEAAVALAALAAMQAAARQAAAKPRRTRKSAPGGGRGRWHTPGLCWRPHA